MEEIKAAVTAMNLEGAAGLEGFGGVFYIICVGISSKLIYSWLCMHFLEAMFYLNLKVVLKL